MSGLDCRTASEKLEALRRLRAEFEAAVRVYAASGKSADKDAALQVKARYDAASAELGDALFEARFPNAERRSVWIGVLSAKGYEVELEREGIQVDNFARDLFRKLESPKERQLMETVRMTAEDLGFTRKTRFQEICERAEKLGLDLAPVEVGPALRLATKVQPEGDRFSIPVKHLTNRHGQPWVFTLSRREGKVWLIAHNASPDFEWLLSSSFVFVRRGR